LRENQGNTGGTELSPEQSKALAKMRAGSPLDTGPTLRGPAPMARATRQGNAYSYEGRMPTHEEAARRLEELQAARSSR
jgi:hypothetical protein